MQSAEGSQTKIGLLCIAACFAATCNASAECIYLSGYTSQEYLTVLAEEDFAKLFTIPLPPGSAPGIAFGMVVGGEHAYLNHTGMFDEPGRVREVDLVLKRVSGEFPTGHLGLYLASAAGKLYAPNAGDDTVTVIDPATGRAADIDGVGDFPFDVAATPDQTRVG